MTAKPYPHAAQKAARRGVLSTSGAKRVEVVLDAGELAMIGNLRAIQGGSQSDVIKQCLADVHAAVFGD
jgi:hypothetical protein